MLHFPMTLAMYLPQANYESVIGKNKQKKSKIDQKLPVTIIAADSFVRLSITLLVILL
ncbi:hypothetical protein YERSI8AC_60039 [Enterobacterales bacterium 8AC]|nr:hypothetical protein YERSI8AC_60039 [Enterobacterales bacterium 8AC]